MPTEKYIIEVDVEINEGIDNIQELKDEAVSAGGEIKTELGGAFKVLDKVTGGAVTKVQGVTGSVKGLSLGFKGLRAAIISTGIGALVIALTSLITYFTQTKRGAELLSRSMAGLRAGVQVLTDRIALLGEGIVNAFENPQKAIENFKDTLQNFVTNRVNELIDGFKGLGRTIKLIFQGEFKEAFKEGKDAVVNLASATNPLIGLARDLKDEIKEVVEEIKEEAKEGARLEGVLQRVADARRALLVETEKTRAEIKELNKIAEDTTKTEVERAAAARKAGELENELLEKRVGLEEMELSALRQKAALGESSAEDLDEIAQKEAEVYRLRQESLELQTTLQNKLNTIEQQAQAKAEANAKKQLELAQERADLELELFATKEEQEVEAARRKFDRLRELNVGNTEELKRITFEEGNQISAIRRAFRDQEMSEEAAAARERLQRDQQLERQKAESREQLFTASLGAIRTISQLFNNGDEKRAKRAFQIQKGVKIAEATAQTYKNVVTAYGKGLEGSFGLGALGTAPAMAGIALAQGLAQVALIARQKFQSTGGGGSGSVGGGTVGEQETSAPLPNLDFLQQGANQQNIRAFVVSKESTDVASQNQLIEDQAKLAG